MSRTAVSCIAKEHLFTPFLAHSHLFRIAGFSKKKNWRPLVSNPCSPSCLATMVTRIPPTWQHLSKLEPSPTRARCCISQVRNSCHKHQQRLLSRMIQSYKKTTLQKELFVMVCSDKCDWKKIFINHHSFVFAKSHFLEYFLFWNIEWDEKKLLLKKNFGWSKKCWLTFLLK